MIGKLTLSAGLLALALAAGAQSAAAAPMSQPALNTAELTSSMVQKTQYWGGCRRWRHECAARWGWRSRGYFRCLWRHGC